MTVIRSLGNTIVVEGEREIDKINLCLDCCATERDLLGMVERIAGEDHQARVHDLFPSRSFRNGKRHGRGHGRLVGFMVCLLVSSHHGDHIDLPIPLIFSLHRDRAVDRPARRAVQRD